MTEKKLQLNVITPDGQKSYGESDMIVMRCTTGDLGVLPGHDEYSALLDYGVIRLIDGADERRLAVYSGIAVIRKDLITVITGEAHPVAEIDIVRANAELEHARQRQLAEKTDLEMQSDQDINIRKLSHHRELPLPYRE